MVRLLFSFFFYSHPATTEIYTFPYTTLFRSSGVARRQPTRKARRRLRLLRGVLGRPAAGGRDRARWRRRARRAQPDRKSTRLNSSHVETSYAASCLTKTKHQHTSDSPRTSL